MAPAPRQRVTEVRRDRVWVCQRIERRLGGGWCVVAQEAVDRSNAVEWDVFAEKSGERVLPPGPSLHHKPDDEMGRLERLIDWPLREH